MEEKWDTVIPGDLKRLFVSGHICPAGQERVNDIYKINIFVKIF
jgi:hypothetical protein